MPKESNSVKRALEILETVSNQPRGMSFSDISTTLCIPKSTLSSLLYTLTDQKYLRRDNETGRYTIGLSMFEVGTRYLNNNYHKEYIVQTLADISKVVNETIHLGVLDKRDVVYLEKFESTQPIRMSSSVGRRMRAHATAIGKSLLSGLSDEEIRQLYAGRSLEKLQANTIDNTEKLLLQMHEIRANGYAWENSESSVDVYCVAVPLKNSSGKVVSAISIAFPLFRVNDEKLALSINILRENAKKLTVVL